MSRVNGVENYNSHKFIFDAEVVDEGNNSAQGSTKVDPANEYGITNSEFILNTSMLALMFTCFSFCYWLSDFQAEYLGADIYVLFYAQGVIALVAG